MFGPYGQIYYEQQGDLTKLPDNNTLDIAIFVPYVQICDESQGDLSELPENHTLDIGTASHHELAVHLASDVFSVMFDINIIGRHILRHYLKKQ